MQTVGEAEAAVIDSDDDEAVDRRPKIVPRVAAQPLPPGALRLAKADQHPIFPKKPRPAGHAYTDAEGRERPRNFFPCEECRQAGVQYGEIDIDDPEYPWIGPAPAEDANVNWEDLPARWRWEACDVCASPDFAGWSEPDGYGPGWVPELTAVEQAELDEELRWRAAAREAAHLASPDGGPECTSYRRDCYHPAANRAHAAEMTARAEECEQAWNTRRAREGRPPTDRQDDLHRRCAATSTLRAARGERILAGAPADFAELRVLLAGALSRVRAAGNQGSPESLRAARISFGQAATEAEDLDAAASATAMRAAVDMIAGALADLEGAEAELAALRR